MTATSLTSVTMNPAQRRYHRIILALSLMVIGLSATLSTVEDRGICLPGLPQFPFPEVCASRRWFQIDCPGCGMTRSFIHFFHGRWSESFRLHRLGWLLAIFTMLQIPYRLFALATPQGKPLGETFSKTVGGLLIAALFLNWLLKLASV